MAKKDTSWDARVPKKQRGYGKRKTGRKATNRKLNLPEKMTSHAVPPRTRAALEEAGTKGKPTGRAGGHSGMHPNSPEHFPRATMPGGGTYAFGSPESKASSDMWKTANLHVDHSTLQPAKTGKRASMSAIRVRDRHDRLKAAQAARDRKRSRDYRTKKRGDIKRSQIDD